MNKFYNDIKNKLEKHQINYDVDGGWKKLQARKGKKVVVLSIYNWAAAACTIPLLILIVYNLTIKNKPSTKITMTKSIPVKKPVENTDTPNLASVISVKPKLNRGIIKNNHQEIAKQTEHKVSITGDNKEIISDASQKVITHLDSITIEVPNITISTQKAIASNIPKSTNQKPSALPFISETESNALMGFNEMGTKESRNGTRLLKRIFTPVENGVATSSNAIIKVNF